MHTSVSWVLRAGWAIILSWSHQRYVYTYSFPPMQRACVAIQVKLVTPWLFFLPQPPKTRTFLCACAVALGGCLAVAIRDSDDEIEYHIVGLVGQVLSFLSFVSVRFKPWLLPSPLSNYNNTHSWWQLPHTKKRLLWIQTRFVYLATNGKPAESQQHSAYKVASWSL